MGSRLPLVSMRLEPADDKVAEPHLLGANRGHTPARLRSTDRTGQMSVQSGGLKYSLHPSDPYTLLHEGTALETEYAVRQLLACQQASQTSRFPVPWEFGKYSSALPSSRSLLRKRSFW
jgi:hypothetical protein